MPVIGIDPSFTSCGVSDGVSHLIVKTEPRDSDPTQADAILRRCGEIIDGISGLILGQHKGEPVTIYIEAPAFGQQSQASHLYELGWLMRELYRMHGRFGVMKIAEVSPTELRKWATGKGLIKKDEMKLAVFKKFGIEFEKDPGCDKLFAYLLCKFGEAVERGDVAFKPSAKRGEKRRKKIAA